MQPTDNTIPFPDTDIAAVDLGSNSFHMIIARAGADGGIQVIDRLKEMVRLGAGLDTNNNLSEESQQRALDCLERFAQRIKHIPSRNIRIVGTNTLRMSKNSAAFLQRAQQILNHRIEIISGIEEARLIYLGVSHSIADSGKRRLVIDIGGGSTETIIGEKFTPLLMESLYMGCVSFSRRFFADGEINKKQMKKADIAARIELERVSRQFSRSGWDEVIGASGTIRAIASVLKEEGLSDGLITPKAMKKLRKLLLNAGHIDKLVIKGLADERRPVFVGGFVVLNALFNELGISSMDISDGAVREGLIYDLLGRIKHEDVREFTVQRFTERYSVQAEHAQRVATTCDLLYQQVKDQWHIADENYQALLRWAALLHECGLTIAHAGYHKHGAYLAQNSDMPGFSYQDQQLLASLIRAHRQKFPTELFSGLPAEQQQAASYLAVILRCAVILHRGREAVNIPDIESSAGKNSLQLLFPEKWLNRHPLTYADLQQEKQLLKVAGFKLKAR